MSKWKKWYILFIVVLMVSLSAGCSGNGNQQVQGDLEDGSDSPVIVRLEGGDYGLSQPFTSYSRGPGMYKVKLVFDALLDKDENGVIPWLAEDWEVLEEGKRYVFQLRKDVYWSDGEAFTAEDVVFTYNYIKEHPPAGASDIVLDESTVKEVRAASDHQVEFILAEANPNLIEAVISVNIVPKHLWEAIERPDEFTSQEALVGTGPFILTDYNKEHGTYRFEAKKDFWGPAPAVDAIEFVPVSDTVLALERGDIDLTTVPVDSLSRFENNPDFTLMENPGVWGYRLRFNMEKVPDLKIKELRQAFAYAIDRQDIVDKIARGAGIAGSMGILPPDHIWFNSNLPSYEKNIEKAKELLTQANLVDKNHEYELLVGEDLEVRMGELIKEHLEDIGIKVRVVSGDAKSRDARIADGSYELVIVGHGGWARDADYLRTRLANTIDDWSTGTPGYSNPEFIRLAEMQIAEVDDNVRKDIFMEIQEILADDIPELPLYMRTGYTVFRNTTYDGWKYEFDHHEATHNKLSYLKY